MCFQVNINGPRGEEKIIDVCDTVEQIKKVTVGQLKQKVTQELRIKGDIRMVFRTEPLEESGLLLSYGIQHMSIIHTVLKLPGGY